MRFAWLIFVFCAIAFTAAPWVSAHAGQTVRISNDAGGDIGAYIEWYAELAHDGTNVVIDGDCWSACVLGVGIMPEGRLCVTRRARFGLHKAFDVKRRSGKLVAVENVAGTFAMRKIYPPKLLAWIDRHGGLKMPPHDLILGFPDLGRIVQICGENGG